MQDVNEEDIYASIATKEHEALVDAIVADALGQSYSIAGDGANLGADLGSKVKLDLEYSKFEPKGEGDDLKIFDANLYGKIADKVGLGVVYMNTKSDNTAYIRDGASKNGFVATADFGGASFKKAGSWGVQAKYYHAPAGSSLMHTMPSAVANDFLDEGYKGWSFGASYTVAKNMMATVTWYDLKGRETEDKEKCLWSEFQLRF
jgi:hypothetical protein